MSSGARRATRRPVARGDVEQLVPRELAHLVEDSPEQPGVGGERLHGEALEGVERLPLLVLQGVETREGARDVRRHGSRIGLLPRADEGDVARGDLARLGSDGLQIEGVLATQHGEGVAQWDG